jgi:hypothetical protein
MEAPMFRHIAVTLLLFPATVLAAVPAVEIEFVQPDRFTDAGRVFGGERERNLELLRQHLVAEGTRRLVPGETLGISFTDVDLAGSLEPRQRFSNEVRIVRDIYPPRFELDFRLARADGSPARAGHRSLANSGFLLGATRHPDDALRYEKALLDGWIDREIGKPAR